MGTRTRAIVHPVAGDVRFRTGNPTQVHGRHGGETGGQTALKKAFFQAYFTEQQNVSDDEVLLDAVETAGLDRAASAATLDDPRFDAVVDAELAHWLDQNISGVPAFIVNGKYMIPGAQDADTFVRVLEKVMEKEAA